MTTKALIVGGGMGGLAAALALLQQGIEVEVHEQAAVLREVGAGLTLSSGSLRALDAIGVLDAVRRVSQTSARMPFLHYRSGALLWGQHESAEGASATPADDPALRHVARHIFRADLQQVLADALRARAPKALRLGSALVAFESSPTRVTARFANGSTAEGDVLIGADGLHSVVRRALDGPDRPDFTGQVAWRFLVDGDRARPFLGAGRGAVFLGPDRVFNRYTLRKGSLLNAVAIVRTPGWQEEGWSTPGDPAELAALFTDWHADVRGLMALAEPGRLNKWALCARAPLPTWRAGRAAVLGDAAHPMLPFLGLGAAMALEDAVVLGRAFALEGDPLRALARYEAARLPRTTAVAEASARQGVALQAKDPDHFKGDDAPIAQPGLFDHDPTTAPL